MLQSYSTKFITEGKRGEQACSCESLTKNCTKEQRKVRETLNKASQSDHAKFLNKKSYLKDNVSEKLNNPSYSNAVPVLLAIKTN